MLVDFQASSTLQGSAFESLCNREFLVAGCELRGRIVLKSIGVEVDQVVVLPDGRTIWAEYKGSVNGDRPGLLRTDTMKKAIANGALIARCAEYWVVTSHLPSSGASYAMMNQALKLRHVDKFVHIDAIQTVVRKGA